MKEFLEKLLIPSEGFSKGHPGRISELIPMEISEGVHGNHLKRTLGGISEQSEDISEGIPRIVSK